MGENYQRSITLQVKDFIRGKLEDEMTPGSVLQPNAVIAENFGVQEQIVGNALDIMVKEGYLERIGDRYQVRGHKLERNMEELAGFTKSIRDNEREPSFKIISKDVRIAGNKYAAMFGIKPEDKLIYIKRLCFADDEPISLERTYIPYYLIPKMEGIDLSIFSVYEIYRMFGIYPATAKETLDLVRPGVNDAKMLGLEPGSPTMLFESITYDTQGRAMEFNRNYTRGDKCNFKVHFYR